MALGAWLVSRMVTDTVPRAGEPSHVRQDIREGFRWTWGHAPVRTLTLAIVTFNVTWGAAWSVLVLYSIKVLGMGSVGFGMLTSVGAVGGLFGTAAYDWLERRFSLAAIMRVGLTIETLTHLALAVNTSLRGGPGDHVRLRRPRVRVGDDVAHASGCGRCRSSSRAGWPASTWSACTAGWWWAPRSAA